SFAARSGPVRDGSVPWRPWIGTRHRRRSHRGWRSSRRGHGGYAVWAIRSRPSGIGALRASVPHEAGRPGAERGKRFAETEGSANDGGVIHRPRSFLLSSRFPVDIADMWTPSTYIEVYAVHASSQELSA